MAEDHDDTGPRIVADRYELLRAVGRGGTGTVWLARDRVLHRQVALKEIHGLPGEDGTQGRAARQEARSAAALNHPNVVAVHDVVDHDGLPWLVMEYVDGPPLSRAVRERGPMTPKGAAQLGAQLAGALAAAHRAGIVHRDVKPANVLLDAGRPKIGDFGIARLRATDPSPDGSAYDETETVVRAPAGTVTGTPSYMAPETAVGGEPDEASDVWALGATIYFAVEGREAYPGQGSAAKTLNAVTTQAPPAPQRAGDLEPILADMLSRDPAARGTMHGARLRLERVAAGEPSAAAPAAVYPGAAPASTAAPGRRGPGAGAVAALTAAVVLVGAALVAGVLFLSGAFSSDDPTPVSQPSTQSPSASAEPSSQDEPSDEPSSPEEPTTVTTTSTESSSPSSSESSESSEDEESSEDASYPSDEVRTFVTDHYAATTWDQDTAWANLTPEMQQTYEDRDAYDEYWGRHALVEPSQIQVDEETGALGVTLKFYDDEGDVVTKRVNLHVTRVGGDLRFAP